MKATTKQTRYAIQYPLTDRNETPWHHYTYNTWLMKQNVCFHSAVCPRELRFFLNATTYSTAFPSRSRRQMHNLFHHLCIYLYFSYRTRWVNAVGNSIGVNRSRELLQSRLVMAANIMVHISVFSHINYWHQNQRIVVDNVTKCNCIVTRFDHSSYYSTSPSRRIKP